MRTTFHVAAACTMIMCHAALASPPSDGVDPDVVIELERIFSFPICGLGYLESRQSQLDALGDLDQMAYLLHLARKDYGAPRELHSLSVALIARRGTAEAHQALRDLFHGPDSPVATRESAAVALARSFEDSTGIQVIHQGLRSTETQVRADMLTTVSYILDRRSMNLVLALATDQDQYVLNRFGMLSQTFPGFRERVLPRLRLRFGGARGDDAARIGFVMLLMGDDRGIQDVRRFLLEEDHAATPGDRYQLMRWCEALAKEGYPLGLDGAARLLKNYLTVEQKGWFGTTINLFANHAGFPERSVHADEDNLRIAQNAIDWWQANRDRLVFDREKGKFVRRYK